MAKRNLNFFLRYNYIQKSGWNLTYSKTRAPIFYHRDYKKTYCFKIEKF